MTTPDERDRTAPLWAKDSRDFHVLYERYGERVLGFALRLTGSRTDAEDLMQEAFTAAYSGRASFQGRSKPLAWLLGIAARRWRDCRRRQFPDTIPLAEEENAPQTVSTPSRRTALEEGVVTSLTLAEALERLAPPFREALLLVASQGLTYKEAAVALGEPAGTVKWRVFEATRKMQMLLRAVEEEYDEMQ